MVTNVKRDSTTAALRIGEVAGRLGLTCRTLRYYEQIGLLKPSSYTKGGERRYTDADVERLTRIRELQDLMGFGLDEIRSIMHAEDKLNQLKMEYQKGSIKRRREIVAEAIAINARLREQVSATIKRSKAFLKELESRAKRYREVESELHAH
ncbi:MAG: MerR family transcriptional regulator [Actinomycetota bacterium]